MDATELTSPVQLKTDDIHVWEVDLTNKASPSALSILSLQEIERANRFKFEHHRHLFLQRRLAYRIILSKYRDNDSAVDIIESDATKPCLRNADGLEFNTSHSGHTGIIAVSLNPVGIDIEKVQDGFFQGPLEAQTFLAKPEQAQLSTYKETEREAKLFQLWTLKEAYLKAIGTGLRIEPTSICIDLETNNVRAMDSHSTIDWYLSELPLNGHKVALCSQLANPTIKRLQFSDFSND